jgi:hypothetical protein
MPLALPWETKGCSMGGSRIRVQRRRVSNPYRKMRKTAERPPGSILENAGIHNDVRRFP